MAILVTGGAGYIGSHTCVELQNAGYDVVVLDNLSNSSEKSLDRVKAITGKNVKFYKGDILDRVWLPIYPAPPVTKIAIIILLVLRNFINLSYGYILTHPAEIV